ncbi:MULTISPECIES: ATP-binding protein [unclassified Maridesulfovibrio]|uniref:ATP-binding protein n=1 Tax=unclassified Maridesulfovibrio TaxID=2794999 RepID=UPI003B3DEDD7
MKTFDLTPDPRVLIALTHTPLKPLDALSELIDNSIDSIKLARNAGEEITNPYIFLDLPSGAEIKEKKGILRIRDNGLGMSPEMTELALKAGFSGNNPYDSLGLFGMGLNIATGKLGCTTRLITARKQDQYAIEVIVDLLDIQEKQTFEVTPISIDKPADFTNGTIIEISNWWPEGNPNCGFIKKLISYGRPKIRKELGRRYATILRDSPVRLTVDEEECTPFEHCVWSDNRFVERQKHGKIYAVQKLSETIRQQTRCTQCYALIPSDKNECQTCGSASHRSIEEKIHGWIGIQRYDHTSDFGIDLIRNGRTIRKFEKSAFFEFTDEFGGAIKDYPIDSQYGRIVGEIHLDHVPVDFLKQHFQTSSQEWLRAMTFLRGESSLQPTKPGADQNISPVYKLYQGYRKVREPGRKDMYMGIWDEDKGKPQRIDRKTESEFLERFNKRQPGYYDDTEWWKLVEQADAKPIQELTVCPTCEAQNLPSEDTCTVCQEILIGKPCLECNENIAISALTCHHCGKSQVPEVQEPWSCNVCGTKNRAATETCTCCESVRGTVNTLSLDYLQKNSSKLERLCISECSVKLADGSQSIPIDVECYLSNKQMIPFSSTAIPAVTFKSDKIQVFLDSKHPLFKSLGIKPEEIVTGEVAHYIHASTTRLSSGTFNAQHSLSNIKWNILNKYWAETLSKTPESVREDVSDFFTEIKIQLARIFHKDSPDIFNNLTETDKKNLAINIVEEGEDIAALSEFKENGKFLLFISPSTIVDIFRQNSPRFFDGEIWDESYSTVADVPGEVMEMIQTELKRTYLNCLEDCCSFLAAQKPAHIRVQRAINSIEFLKQKMSF